MFLSVNYAPRIIKKEKTLGKSSITSGASLSRSGDKRHAISLFSPSDTSKRGKPPNHSSGLYDFFFFLSLANYITSRETKEVGCIVEVPSRELRNESLIFINGGSFMNFPMHRAGGIDFIYEVASDDAADWHY